MVIASRSRASAGDLLDGIPHARGCFRVHDGDEIESPVFERALDVRGIDGAAPFDVERRHVGAIAPEQIRKTGAEVAGHDRERPFSRLSQIADDGLHSRRAGAGDRERQRAGRRAEDLRESRAYVVEKRHELRIEMRSRGRAEGRQHAR